MVHSVDIFIIVIVIIYTVLSGCSYSTKVGQFIIIRSISCTVFVCSCCCNVVFNKAGRFVGKAGCYAVVAFADNATFSLAVNRMATFRTQAANRSHQPYILISCRGATRNRWSTCLMRLWVQLPPVLGFFHIFLATSAYAVGAELSYLGFG